MRKEWMAMKVKIAIEEIIVQEFEVEVSSMENAYDEVFEKYKNGELVVEDPECHGASLMIYDENDNETEWCDLHV
jgi:hypothetical protein